MNICSHSSSFVTNTRMRLFRMPLYQSVVPHPQPVACCPSFVSTFCQTLCSIRNTTCTAVSWIQLDSREQQLQRLSSNRSFALMDGCLWKRNGSLTVVGVRSRPSFGMRWYSTDNEDENNDRNANAALKGVVVHVPSPLMWLKNKWYSYCIRSAVDSSFRLDEFVLGAKQALSFLTRLIVQKDYEMLKSVATQEAVDTVMQLVMPWNAEQQQSIEVLVSDITLAAAHITSLEKRGPNDYEVNVDMLCIAVKRFKTRPLLIQMTVKFKREYSGVTASDWMIADIREFTVRELTVQSSQEP